VERELLTADNLRGNTRKVSSVRLCEEICNGTSHVSARDKLGVSTWTFALEGQQRRRTSIVKRLYGKILGMLRRKQGDERSVYKRVDLARWRKKGH